MRKESLVTGEIYHIYNKSIAGFEIFNNDLEFIRIKKAIQYYKSQKRNINFSKFKNHSLQYLKNISQSNTIIQIICYCLMPTHIHLVVKQLKDRGISKFMNNVLNSYSRYFNLRHKRKGPLWEGRFKNVLIDNDEQLLHLTRYIHLNPVTAHLVDSPEDWNFSSYNEYISKISRDDAICDYDFILDIAPISYKRFVENRISYQGELAKIKDLII